MTGLNRVQTMSLAGVLMVVFHQNYQMMQAIGVAPDPFLSISAVVLIITFAWWDKMVRGIEALKAWRSASRGEPS